MPFVEVHFGVSTADAENVELHFDGAALVLSFRDWQGVPRQLIFHNILAFRWQDFDEKDIRDDTTYEVLESEWLARQVYLQGVAGVADNYAHYKLCFNALGVLDILGRRVTCASNDANN